MKNLFKKLAVGAGLLSLILAYQNFGGLPNQLTYQEQMDVYKKCMSDLKGKSGYDVNDQATNYWEQGCKSKHPDEIQKLADARSQKEKQETYNSQIEKYNLCMSNVSKDPRSNEPRLKRDLEAQCIALHPDEIQRKELQAAKEKADKEALESKIAKDKADKEAYEAELEKQKLLDEQEELREAKAKADKEARDVQIAKNNEEQSQKEKDKKEKEESEYRAAQEIADRVAQQVKESIAAYEKALQEAKEAKDKADKEARDAQIAKENLEREKREYDNLNEFEKCLFNLKDKPGYGVDANATYYHKQSCNYLNPDVIKQLAAEKEKREKQEKLDAQLALFNQCLENLKSKPGYGTIEYATEYLKQSCTALHPDEIVKEKARQEQLAFQKQYNESLDLFDKCMQSVSKDPRSQNPEFKKSMHMQCASKHPDFISASYNSKENIAGQVISKWLEKERQEKEAAQAAKDREILEAKIAKEKAAEEARQAQIAKEIAEQEAIEAREAQLAYEHAEKLAKEAREKKLAAEAQAAKDREAQLAKEKAEKEKAEAKIAKDKADKELKEAQAAASKAVSEQKDSARQTDYQKCMDALKSKPGFGSDPNATFYWTQSCNYKKPEVINKLENEKIQKEKEEKYQVQLNIFNKCIADLNGKPSYGTNPQATSYWRQTCDSKHPEAVSKAILTQEQKLAEEKQKAREEKYYKCMLDIKSDPRANDSQMKKQLENSCLNAYKVG